MKCKRSSDGCKLDHHTLQAMRQQAAKAIREGTKAGNLCDSTWTAATTCKGKVLPLPAMLE